MLLAHRHCRISCRWYSDHNDAGGDGEELAGEGASEQNSSWWRTHPAALYRQRSHSKDYHKNWLAEEVNILTNQRRRHRQPLCFLDCSCLLSWCPPLFDVTFDASCKREKNNALIWLCQPKHLSYIDGHILITSCLSIIHFRHIEDEKYQRNIHESSRKYTDPPAYQRIIEKHNKYCGIHALATTQTSRMDKVNHRVWHIMYILPYPPVNSCQIQCFNSLMILPSQCYHTIPVKWVESHMSGTNISRVGISRPPANMWLSMENT